MQIVHHKIDTLLVERIHPFGSGHGYRPAQIYSFNVPQLRRKQVNGVRQHGEIISDTSQISVQLNKRRKRSPPSIDVPANTMEEAPQSCGIRMSQI
ncbi:MAG: hypothetical protein Devi2KO_27480 [Devosia indica]